MDDHHTLNDLVASEIRGWLGKRRMSGRQLAAKLDVSQTWMSTRLRGTTEIGLAELERIAEALGVEVSDLLPSPARRDERTSGRINERSRPRTARTRPELLHSRPAASRTAHDDRHDPAKTRHGGGHTARPAWTCEGVTA